MDHDRFLAAGPSYAIVGAPSASFSVSQRSPRSARPNIISTRVSTRTNSSEDPLNALRATDVIAFRLPHADEVFGDVYVCPAEARRSARQYRVPVREELIRLVIHGTLHVLGYDHPAGESRIHSSMWARQEGYVVAVQSGAGP